MKDIAHRHMPGYRKETMMQPQNYAPPESASIEEYVVWLRTRCGPDGALAAETLQPLLPGMEQRTAVAVLKQAIAVCGAD